MIVDNFYGNKEEKERIYGICDSQIRKELGTLACFFVICSYLHFGYTDTDTVSYFSIVFPHKIKIQEKLLSSTFFI